MAVRLFLKSVLRALFAVTVLLGAVFRYARTFLAVPGWFGALPWALLLLFGALTLLLLPLEMPDIGRLDLLFLCLFCLVGLTYLISTWRLGVASQLPLGGDFLLPLPVYFAVRWDRQFTAEFLGRLLVPFSLIAAALSIVEFYTVNFGQPIFNFSGYWNDVGNVGYHASAVHYAFLGFRNRPWGVLALPEASGTLMAALALYFAAGRKSPVRFFCMAVCLAAAYASGSRTAILTVAVFGLVIVWQSRMSIFFKVFAAVAALLAAVGEMVFFTRFYVPQLEVHGFINRTVGNFWHLITPAHPVNLMLHAFVGGGIVTPNNPLASVTGEVALLNWAAYVGLLAWLIMLVVFLSTVTRYARLQRLAPAAALRVRAAYVLLLALAFGSLHYDALSRYPTSLMAIAVVALLVRPAPAGDEHRNRARGAVAEWDSAMAWR